MEVNYANPKEFNLIPPAILKREEARKIKGSLLICITTIIFLCAIVWWRFPAQEELLKRFGKPPPPAMRLLPSQWKLLESRRYFTETLSTLAESANGKIWLSSLSYDAKTKTMVLFGQGYSAERITEMLQVFQEKVDFKTGKVVSLTQHNDLMRFKWEGTLP